MKINFEVVKELLEEINNLENLKSNEVSSLLIHHRSSSELKVLLDLRLIKKHKRLFKANNYKITVEGYDFLQKLLFLSRIYHIYKLKTFREVDYYYNLELINSKYPPINKH
jgi:RIO-like serine/threonine protein kinase